MQHSGLKRILVFVLLLYECIGSSVSSLHLHMLLYTHFFISVSYKIHTHNNTNIVDELDEVVLYKNQDKDFLR